MDTCRDEVIKRYKENRLKSWHSYNGLVNDIVVGQIVTKKMSI